MKKMMLVFLIISAILGCQAQQKQEAPKQEWVSLFNGENLDGWTASENQGTFTVENGAIKVHGKRSHLFYTGQVNNANFKISNLKRML